MSVAAIEPTGRVAERRHLFFGATLAFGSGSVPVRVRNLSASGALVEGAALPVVGEPLRLVRGPLSAGGTTVWTAPGRIGVTFDCALNVDEWISGRMAGVLVPLSREAALADLARLPPEMEGIALMIGESHPASGRMEQAAARIARIVAALAPR